MDGQPELLPGLTDFKVDLDLDLDMLHDSNHDDVFRLVLLLDAHWLRAIFQRIKFTNFTINVPFEFM